MHIFLWDSTIIKYQIVVLENLIMASHGVKSKLSTMIYKALSGLPSDLFLCSSINLRFQSH